MGAVQQLKDTEKSLHITKRKKIAFWRWEYPQGQKNIQLSTKLIKILRPPSPTL